MSEEETNVREAKRAETELAAIDQAVELFPHLDRDEARILMLVLGALGPMLNQGQATVEHEELQRLVGNYKTRRSEVKTNPIAEVKAYKPKHDPNW